MCLPGGCSLVVDGVDRVIDAVEPYPTDAGRRAFGIPAAWLLKMLGRTEFRLLREAGPNRENVTTISGPGESPAIGEQPRLGPPSHSAP